MIVPPRAAASRLPLVSAAANAPSGPLAVRTGEPQILAEIARGDRLDAARAGRELVRGERVAERRDLAEPALLPDGQRQQRRRHADREHAERREAPSVGKRKRRPEEEEGGRGLDA